MINEEWHGKYTDPLRLSTCGQVPVGRAVDWPVSLVPGTFVVVVVAVVWMANWFPCKMESFLARSEKPIWWCL